MQTPPEAIVLTLSNFYRVKVTYLHANTTTHASIWVDSVGLTTLTGNGIYRAIAGANGAAGAGAVDNFEADQ